MFTDKSIPSTRITAAWLNSIQEELCYAIEQSGITLDTQNSDTRTQLYEALTALGVTSPNTTTSTLTDNGTFTQDYGVKYIYFLDGGTSNRNFNPSGTFTAGYEVIIINQGSTNSITFDSTGIARTLEAGASAIFIYNGSAWKHIYESAFG